MTQWFLNTFFRGKWNNYGHFSLTSLGIIGLFPFIQLWANVVYVLMTLKEVYEWRVRGYFDWEDQTFNTLAFVLSNLYCFVVFYWLGNFVLI